ncbi:NADPH-dependent F420 reductase [Sphingobium sp. AN558]
MKIGIIGAGSIGATIARKLAAAGHDVKIANSKGPETLSELAQAQGVTAVHKEEAVQNVDVIILSIPFLSYAALASLLSGVPSNVVVIDTSNYYPFRDGEIEGIDGGEAESLWVSKQIGRPLVKAWNAVLAGTLVNKGKPAGAEGRIAVPVAGDDAAAKRIAMELVDATGFDAFDSGSLVDSWRQQTGTPAYCTELTIDELPSALDSANREKRAHNREAILKEVFPRYAELSHDDIIAINRSMTR